MNNNNKVKLPQFIIDEIEDIKSSFDKNNTLPQNVGGWLILDSNKDKLINAIMNGYEVEQEQLYYVKIIDKNADDAFIYLNQNLLTNNIQFNSMVSDKLNKTQFTLDEIKEIDERYLAFAVKVEDN